MWKTLYQSVQGTSHVRTGRPCQDSSTARELALKNETVLVLACSDGAGSAEHSEIGSRLACEKIADVISGELQARENCPPIHAEQALDWIRQVHESLEAEALLREIPIRQLACTLLFAVVGQSGAAFGQIGDGAIVVWQDERYQNIFWPQSGEYANTTNFVSDPQFHSRFEFAWCDGSIDELALFTDGLQMLGLDFQERRAHGPFFAPLFETLRKEQPADLVVPMRNFLESEVVAERTDDDKTLVLATRVAR